MEGTKVLLHSCCAPCSSAIIEWMMGQGLVPVIYYCNPNIYPVEEYNIRKDEITRYAEKLGLEVVDADYDHDRWLEAAAGLENEPERGGRCLKCFKLRLLRTAEYAKENGFEIIATTLASSRWKSLDQINQAGLWACNQVNDSLSEGPEVVWWDKNWRKGGLQNRRNELLKENGFYNQQYCGCEFSIRPNLNEKQI